MERGRGRSPSRSRSERLFCHACVAEREPKAHRGFAARGLHGWSGEAGEGEARGAREAGAKGRAPRGLYGGSGAAARASPRGVCAFAAVRQYALERTSRYGGVAAQRKLRYESEVDWPLRSPPHRGGAGEGA